MKKVLLLGAGLVTRPLVRYLLDQPNIELIIASRTVSKAEKLLEGHPKGKSVSLNVKDEEDKLEQLVGEADVVISLLPWIYHLKVAHLCLTHEKHLITTSYVSPEMKELDEKAREKGLLFLNEIGLDPGIDHMSAMKIIEDVKNRGGKITSFESVCGGLPAPEDNDNPFGYKFSWSPRGVILAGRNNAHYLKDGLDKVIEGKDLFLDYWEKEVNQLGKLEVYPNRDSMIYQELYELWNSKTIFRGTFRNLGWCETLYSIAKMGWLDDTLREELKELTLVEVTSKLVGTDKNDVVAKTAELINQSEDSNVMQNLKWLGLFEEVVVEPEQWTYLDILSARMQLMMPYKDGEKDMIVLQHDFMAEFPDAQNEHIISLMIDYGIPDGDSAMARTVSLPAAIATRFICEGKFDGIAGVYIPNIPEIYNPVLEELERLNIKMVDTINYLEQ
ncbi:MAG: saccharopine dehydrogenase C-terminal domain-containing protein [Melioribacteraceae bacterium]|nr:saccharopine dehydrogenase C-terminal domain-containing protein [Melioribacteraceae bacterium]